MAIAELPFVKALSSFLSGVFGKDKAEEAERVYHARGSHVSVAEAVRMIVDDLTPEEKKLLFVSSQGDDIQAICNRMDLDPDQLRIKSKKLQWRMVECLERRGIPLSPELRRHFHRLLDQ